MGILNSITARFRKPSESKLVVIHVGGTGMSVTEGDNFLFSVDWADTKEVVAFKRDYFAVDAICLGFRVDDADRYLEVSEDFVNFKVLCTELPRLFPGLRNEWYTEVAFPAFEMKWTTIWGSPLEVKQSGGNH